MIRALQFVVEALDLMLVQPDLSFECRLHLLQLVGALVESIKQHRDLRSRSVSQKFKPNQAQNSTKQMPPSFRISR
jgi:hypothetical protein